jgi:hypothetical protein
VSTTTFILIHLISGLIGGNLGGMLIHSIRDKYALGFAGNSVAGIAGGLFIGFFARNRLPPSIADSHFNLVSLSLAAGGMAGIVAAVLVGIIKSKIDAA